MKTRWEERSLRGNGRRNGDCWDGFTADPGDARGEDVHVVSLWLAHDGWKMEEAVLGPREERRYGPLVWLVRSLTLREVLRLLPAAVRERAIVGHKARYVSEKRRTADARVTARRLREELAEVRLRTRERIK